jgi:23S rRNA (adenine2503-C2)-methyltransferase
LAIESVLSLTVPHSQQTLGLKSKASRTLFKLTLILAPHSPLRIAHLRLRLRDLGAKPCHEDRLLRGWSQIASYDRKNSPAVTFFPLAMRRELPALEAELAGLARLHGEYPADEEVARLLVELNDGQMVESVLLPRGGLCVSTQVGCAVGCVFCMSGRAGLIRQLGSAEIVAQVVLARRRRTVSKVVFMGMGEPAHNLDNVLEAIELLGTQGNIGHKSLVFSTVGDARVFERLAQEKVKPALALSLHSTDAALRAQLLPRAPEMRIEELVERAEVYARATSYPVQYQWTLLEDINDSDAELAGIARLLVGKYAVMNFIPFNAVDGLGYRRPTPERIAIMVDTLRQHGILAKVRDSAGQEIEGACGQLRARAVKERRSKKISFETTN